MPSHFTGPLSLTGWNEGLFSVELLKQQDTTPISNTKTDLSTNVNVFSYDRSSARTRGPSGHSEVTWEEVKMTAYTVYKRLLEDSQISLKKNGYEPSLPQRLTLSQQRSLYTFEVAGKYPPHLRAIPQDVAKPPSQIFHPESFKDVRSLLRAGFIDGFLGHILRPVLNWRHESTMGDTIAKIEENYRALRQQHIQQRINLESAYFFESIQPRCQCYNEETIGERDDWYTDAVFAQSQFTGTNPTTIKMADSKLIDDFLQAANEQANDEKTRTPTIDKMAKHLQSVPRGKLYVQDNSYFRDAVGAKSNDPLKSGDDKEPRYACASVCLFELHSNGQLHPVAIVIDYRGSMSNSVVIFNQRLEPGAPTDSEASDWPWRYAKNCALVSDWLRHELTVHLTNTHLVEEAVIVAAYRSFEYDHPVFQLLTPHWEKTLSLNALARSTLVPSIIAKLVGITETQVYAFIKDAYKKFDFTGLYVPTDLKNRGFPEEFLGTGEFCNYAYAKNMSKMWKAIHTFVGAAISQHYPTDESVYNDLAIRTWAEEMRSERGANLTSFPNITNISQLINAITMCIHIASPQHTAVNYLQHYYQSFVISKPPAVCAPLPTTLADLQVFTEKQMIDALPVKRILEWLLASHLPHLLSIRVGVDESLKTYAVSLARVAHRDGDLVTANAARDFFFNLRDLGEEFKNNSKGMTPGTIPYNVMDPENTAVSILI